MAARGGKLKVRFKAPTRPGDTVTASAQLAKEADGVAEYAVQCANQRGEVLIEGRASVAAARMSERRAAAAAVLRLRRANERGLHMEFRREGDRTICDYTPCDYQQGYPGRMHGGVVVDDDRRSDGLGRVPRARSGARRRASTCASGSRCISTRQLRVEAWIVRNRGRLIELRAEVRDDGGALLAEGDGTFMKLDERMAGEMSELAREHRPQRRAGGGAVSALVTPDWLRAAPRRSRRAHHRVEHREGDVRRARTFRARSGSTARRPAPQRR